jgi:pyruvate kinase
MEPAYPPTAEPLAESPCAPGWGPGELGELLAALDALRAEMLASENDALRRHPGLHGEHAAAARNLAHYLALRRHDLRAIQTQLRERGLATLARTEGHVLASIDAVRCVLYGLLGRSPLDARPGDAPVGMREATRLLDRHAHALFGPRPAGRRNHVMVTLPSEASHDLVLVRALVGAGMNVARINCAHGDEGEWARTIEHVRRASAELMIPVRVLMDLGGPKLRTGVLEPGPCVVHWKPRRNERGTTTAPARVWLSNGRDASPTEPVDVELPVGEAWLATLRRGDVVEFQDLRGRRRRLPVARADAAGALLLAHDAAWVETGTRLVRRQASGDAEGKAETFVGPLPPTESKLTLRRGDVLTLTKDARPGRPAVRDGDGGVRVPARIPCTLPDVFAHVEAGDAVWLDDGHIGGRVLRATPDTVDVEITRASADGSRLGADKGINLPDTRLDLRGLTEKDAKDLEFVRAHADLVGLSFVEDPDHLRDLWRRLEGGRALGVVVKIETRRGFARLPDLLLAAMEGFPVGVMIARGDLAVECGFERLAEVQEEMLWMCEAAHVPVVWATQVLETLAKTGFATRAEITDAAMSERAECVMLNKGPHIVEALRVLDDVLRRMQEHQSKKHALLRPLSISTLDRHAD